MDDAAYEPKPDALLESEARRTKEPQNAALALDGPSQLRARVPTAPDTPENQAIALTVIGPAVGFTWLFMFMRHFFSVAGNDYIGGVVCFSVPVAAVGWAAYRLAFLGESAVTALYKLAFVFVVCLFLFLLVIASTPQIAYVLLTPLAIYLLEEHCRAVSDGRAGWLITHDYLDAQSVKNFKWAWNGRNRLNGAPWLCYFLGLVADLFFYWWVPELRLAWGLMVFALTLFAAFDIAAEAKEIPKRPFGELWRKAVEIESFFALYNMKGVFGMGVYSFSGRHHNHEHRRHELMILSGVVSLALVGMFRLPSGYHPFFYIFCGMVITAFAAAAPYLYLVATEARHLLALEAEVNRIAAENKAKGRTVHDLRVEKVFTSPHAEERRHFPFGNSWHNGYPILVPIKLAGEHILITGGPGCGKSTLSLLPFASVWPLANWYKPGDERYSVLWINLKGSMKNNAEEHYLTNFAHSVGMHTSILTTTDGYQSNWFDPLAALRKLGQSQRAQAALRALGVSHDPNTFGEGYFSSVVEAKWVKLASKYNPETLAKMFGYAIDPQAQLAAGMRGREGDDARHLDNILYRLAGLNILNPPPNLNGLERKHAFDLERFCKRPSLYIFKCAAALEPATASNVCQLIFADLLAQASRIPVREMCRVIVCIDEGHLLFGPQLPTFLEICRQLGISFAFTAHSWAQMRRPRGLDLTDLIKSLVAIQIHHEVNDTRMMDFLQRMGGGGRWPKPTTTRTSSSGGVTSVSQAIAEEVRPLWEDGALRRLSAQEKAAIIMFRRGAGVATAYEGRLAPVTLDWIMSARLHQQLDAEPWFRNAPGTVTVRDEPPPLPGVTANKRKPKGPRGNRRDDRSMREQRRRAFEFGE